MVTQTIENIVFINEYEHKIRRFNVTARRLEFRFLDYNGQGTPIDWLRRGLNDIINNGMRGFANTDRIGITFFNADFTDRPLPMSFRRRDQISADAILDTLAKVLQSNASFLYRLLKLFEDEQTDDEDYSCDDDHEQNEDRDKKVVI
ncbi:unnamed protein product [Brassicogethes aeneus]|uniref:Uncharacterized protein n=1 Tax=Brassicogethes aeneus TaxID=1431903 RepID=A0A9P0ATL0_BRAAE|nr:unnamed protein product [Brassicogethes aeneus]